MILDPTLWATEYNTQWALIVNPDTDMADRMKSGGILYDLHRQLLSHLKSITVLPSDTLDRPQLAAVLSAVVSVEELPQ